MLAGAVGASLSCPSPVKAKNQGEFCANWFCWAAHGAASGGELPGVWRGERRGVAPHGCADGDIPVRHAVILERFGHDVSLLSLFGRSAGPNHFLRVRAQVIHYRG